MLRGIEGIFKFAAEVMRSDLTLIFFQMKHKFFDFKNANRDFGENLVLQFIGFAQSNSKLKFSTKYSDPL